MVVRLVQKIRDEEKIRNVRNLMQKFSNNNSVLGDSAFVDLETQNNIRQLLSRCMMTRSES